MDSSLMQSERIEVADDLWAVNAFFEEKGWTDGLPIIPPTEERVGQMLAAGKRNPQDVIGVVPNDGRRGSSTGARSIPLVGEGGSAGALLSRRACITCRQS